MNVLNNKQDKKDYLARVFSVWGHSTLTRYLMQLVKYYQSGIKYPYVQGIVLGLPLIQSTQKITSKEELLGRIKAYMMLLGIKSVDITLDNGTIITFEIPE